MANGQQTSPVNPPYGYINGQWKSPFAGEKSEWELVAEARERLLADLGARLQLRDTLAADGFPPDTAAAIADISASEAAINRFNGASSQQELNELIGRAQDYGLSYDEASSMTPAQLRATIASGRVGRLDHRIRQFNLNEPGVVGTLGRALGEGAAALGVGMAESVVDLLQNTAFIGNTLGKTEVVNQADRWLARLDEGIYSEQMTAGQQRAWTATTGSAAADILDPTARVGDEIGVAQFIPYMYTAYRTYAMLGRLGTMSGFAQMGSRMPVLARSAVKGMGTEALLEANRPIPLGEKLAYIAAGGAFSAGLEAGGRVAGATIGGVAGGLGVAFGDDDPTMPEILGGVGAGAAAGYIGLPFIMRRLRGSFRTATSPYDATVEYHQASSDDFHRMTGGTFAGGSDWDAAAATNTGGFSAASWRGNPAQEEMAGALVRRPFQDPGFYQQIDPMLPAGPRQLPPGPPAGLPPGPPPPPTGRGFSGGPGYPGQPRREPTQLPAWTISSATEAVTGRPATFQIHGAASGPWNIGPTMFASDKPDLPLAFSGNLDDHKYRYLTTYNLRAENPYVLDDDTAPLVAQWLLEDNPGAIPLDFSMPDQSTIIRAHGLVPPGASRELIETTAFILENGVSRPDKWIGNIMESVQRRGHDVLISRYGDTYYNWTPGSREAREKGQEIIPLDPRLQLDVEQFYTRAMRSMGRGLGAGKYAIPRDRPRPDFRLSPSGVSTVRRGGDPIVATENQVASWAAALDVDVETAAHELRELGVKLPSDISQIGSTAHDATLYLDRNGLYPYPIFNKLNEKIQSSALRMVETPEQITDDQVQRLMMAEADPATALIAARGGIYNESEQAMLAEFGAERVGNFFVVPATEARRAAVQLEHWHDDLVSGYGMTREEALNGLRGKMGRHKVVQPLQFDIKSFAEIDGLSSPNSGYMANAFFQGFGHRTEGVASVFLPAKQVAGKTQSVMQVTSLEAQPRFGSSETGHAQSRLDRAGEMLRGLVEAIEQRTGQRVDVISIKDFGISSGKSRTVQIPRERLFRTVVDADRVIDDAIAYMKQQEITKSPLLADKALNTQFTDVDVVQAAVANNPGAVTVLRGIDVDPKILKSMVQERTDKKLMPHNFRYVKHPDGRMDLMIGAGRNMSNAQVKQHEQFGMFKSQQAIVNGQLMEITGFQGTDKVWVRPVMSGSSAHAHTVPIENVLPTNTSGARRPPNADAAYTALREETRRYMATESEKLGMEEPDWLSEEVSSTLPMMVERTLDNMGIEDPLERAVHTAYFDWRRVQDFKALAPQAYAWSRQTQQNIINEVSGLPARLKPVDELAEEAGWILRENPEDMTYTLRHAEGDLEITVQELDDVLPVIRTMSNADREDLTPASLFPLEAIETVGSAGASNRPPRAARGAPSAIAAKLRTNETMSRAIDQEIYEIESGQLGNATGVIDNIGGGGPGAGGGGRGGGGSGGGGGGRPPVPPAGGGGLPPEGGPLGLGGASPESLIEDRLRRGHDLHNLAVADRRAVNWLTKIFYPMRFQMERSATILNDVGITYDVNQIYQLYSKIDDGMRKVHNAMKPWIDEANEWLLDVRAEYRRKGTFLHAVQLPADRRLAYMDKMEFTAAERAAVDKYHDFLNRVQIAAHAEGINLSSLHDYAAHVRARLDRGLRDQAYAWKDMPEGMRFFGEYARKHNLNFRQMDVSELTNHWLRAWKNGVHVAPHADELQKTWLNSRTLNGALPRTTLMLREWLDIVKFGRPQGDDLLVDAISGVFQKVGIPVTSGDALRMLGGVQLAMYRAALGLSPAAITRDSLSILIPGSKVGMAHINDAVQMWKNGTPEQIADMINRGLEGGWLAKGQSSLPDTGFSHQATNQLGLSELTPELLARREAMAGALDSINDMLPRRYRLGLQGTKADPLLLYTKLNEWSRVIAGEAGYQRASKAWDSFLEHGQTDRLMRESGASLWERSVQHMAETFIRQGDRIGLQELLANETAGMLGRYGTTNAPAFFRSTLGKLATMYGTFTMQYVAYGLAGTAGNLGRAISGRGLDKAMRREQLKGAAGFAGRMGAVMTAVWGTGELLDWDFDKWMWAKSVAYPGGPAASTGLGVVGAVGAGLAEAVGERPSIYQEALRSSLQREMDMRGGVAGYMANTFNPYAGGVRTIGGYIDALTNENRPFERAANFTFTGKTGFPREVEEWYEDYVRNNEQFLSPPGAGAME